MSLKFYLLKNNINFFLLLNYRKRSVIFKMPFYFYNFEKPYLNIIKKDSIFIKKADVKYLKTILYTGFMLLLKKSFYKIYLQGLGFYYDIVDSSPYIYISTNKSHFLLYKKSKFLMFYTSDEKTPTFKIVGYNKQFLFNYIKNILLLHKPNVYKGHGIHLKGNLFKIKDFKKKK